MAHFARLNDDDVVIEVHVVANSDILYLEFPASEPVGQELLKKIWGPDTVWKQTSYNKQFRGNFACIGGKYDRKLNAFLPKKPFESWVLNTNKLIYEPPVPYPQDGERYFWDERHLKWGHSSEYPY